MIDEQGLIARAQRGDLQAYEQLVQHYEQIAFRVAYLITHDEHEAADTAQDAFLRAYRSLGSFNWVSRCVPGCCASSPTRRSTGFKRRNAETA